MKKISTIVISVLSFMMLASAALAPVPALANGTNPPAPTDQKTPNDLKISFHIDNPLGDQNGTLEDFIANVLDAVVLLLSPVVVVMLLYSGLLFVLARGNTEKLGTAKTALMYTLIGAAVVLGAKGFALVIQNTVTCLGGGTC